MLVFAQTIDFAQTNSVSVITLQDLSLGCAEVMRPSLLVLVYKFICCHLCVVSSCFVYPGESNVLVAYASNAAL